MEVKELGHLVLYVRDIGRSVAFYRDVLGWRQVLPTPGGDGAGPLPAPFAMFNAPSGRTHHELLLIEVGPDAAALRTLREAGATVLGATDHVVTHNLDIADPDGNEMEGLQPTARSDASRKVDCMSTSRAWTGRTRSCWRRRREPSSCEPGARRRRLG